MNPMDLSIYVAEQVGKEGLVAPASAGDEEAQTIINSIARHQSNEFGLQIGRTVVVGGLSVAALFLGGGVAIVGGLAGAGDGALNIRTAAQLGRFAETAAVGGAELVDTQAAKQAQALAWLDLTFGVLDVVQVGGMVRGLAQGRQLAKLFAAQDVLTSLSPGQQHRVHVWVRQQATGQTGAAARSRRSLESELGVERFTKVDQAFGQMLEGLSSGRVEALRNSLGEEIFTKMSARFGGKAVAKWTSKHGAASVRRLSEALDPETAGALLDALDPQSLARLGDLEPQALVDLGGQLGLQRLNEVGRHLTGTQLQRLHDKVGPDFERLLRVPDLEDLVDPDVVDALATAPKQVLSGMLGNAVPPRLIADLIVQANKLSEVVRVPLLKYLAKSPVDEATAALKVLKAEALDNAHAVARHGPHITEAQLRKRLATGIAPDGSQGRGHWAATKFRSFRVMWRSRQAALQGGLKALGVDIRFRPGQGGNPPGSPHLIAIEHGRQVSRGVFSAAPYVQIPKPGTLSGTVKSFSDAVDSAGYITRTQATVSWEEGRWQVKQHFPGVKYFDKEARVYTERAIVYLQSKQ